MAYMIRVLFLFSLYFLTGARELIGGILGIGTPSVDYLVSVKEDYLSTIAESKGGCVVVDFNLFEKILKDNKSGISIATGGSGANTIKGIACLNIKSAILGKIGTDYEGNFFINHIRNFGITPFLIPSDLKTQQILCLITPDNERTMFCYQGASTEFHEKDLKKEFFLGFNHIHIEGYAIRNDKVIETSISFAKECGSTVSFDCGCFELVREHREKILSEIVPHLDILFANQDEAYYLTGKEPVDACTFLHKMCPLVVILVGKDGCFVGSQGSILHVTTTPANIVDTTGAGDLFASGFLYGFLKGYPATISARIGNLLGGKVVEVLGAEIPKDDWPALLDRIKKIEEEQ